MLSMGIVLGIATEQLFASESPSSPTSPIAREHTVTPDDVRTSIQPDGHFISRPSLNMDRRISILKAIAKNPSVVTAEQKRILIEDGEAMSKGWDTHGYGNYPSEEQKRRIEKIIEKMRHSSR